MNGGQANGQSYYNMMNQKNDQQQYGYYNEYGEYIDLCMSDADGYTDSSGREYDITCDEYESKMMICTDGSLCDYCEYAVDQQYMPCDEYVCKDYYTYCSELYEPNYKKMYNDDYQQQQNNDDYQYYGQQQYQYRNNNGGYEYYDYDYAEQTEQNELYKFLECTEYINEYDQQYFVGPHCASDHYTISLGVFADENCVEYLGETISLSKVLGYGYDEESFFHLPHECISCDGAVSNLHDSRFNLIFSPFTLISFSQFLFFISFNFNFFHSNNLKKKKSDIVKCIWDKGCTEITSKHPMQSLTMLLPCAQLFLNEVRNVTYI